MTMLNLRDRRALEAIVSRMDTEAIGRNLDEGGLSAFAREVVAEELARRVLADEVDYGLRARRCMWRVPGFTGSDFVTDVYLVWLAWMLGHVLLAVVR